MSNIDDDFGRGDWERDQIQDRRLEEMREREQAELAKIPTPITDAALEKTWQSVNVPTNAIPADVARDLERRLSKANKEITLACLRERAALDDYKYQKEKADDALLLLAEAQRERDNAISDHKQADADTLRALHERNEARKLLEECQKDLATALREIDHLMGRRKRQLLCGWRGFAGGEGCILPLGHEGGHGFSDGSGNQPNAQAGGVSR